jgi:hypothetical protein
LRAELVLGPVFVAAADIAALTLLSPHRTPCILTRAVFANRVIACGSTSGDNDCVPHDPDAIAASWVQPNARVESS